MEKLILKREDFDGQEFNCVMASGNGRRLWVTYKDGGVFFQVEKLGGKYEIVLKTISLNKAMRKFNSL